MYFVFKADIVLDKKEIAEEVPEIHRLAILE